MNLDNAWHIKKQNKFIKLYSPTSQSFHKKCHLLLINVMAYMLSALYRSGLGCYSSAFGWHIWLVYSFFRSIPTSTSCIGLSWWCFKNTPAPQKGHVSVEREEGFFLIVTIKDVFLSTLLVGPYPDPRHFLSTSSDWHMKYFGFQNASNFLKEAQALFLDPFFGVIILCQRLVFDATVGRLCLLTFFTGRAFWELSFSSTLLYW